MTTFSDYSQVSQESVRIGGPISDSQDRQSQSSVSNQISDRQYIQFPLLDVLTSSGTCETIQCSGNKALLYLYESTMDSLGLQETINPTMINDEQVASAAIYGPSVGVDRADWAVYPTPKSTEREEINDCEAAHLFFSTQGNGSGMGVPLAKNNTVCWKMKKIKTDCGSVLETNVPVLLKKPKRDRCKSSLTSSVTKDHENLNPKLDVIKRDAPELLANNVQEEPKTGSQNDYIHVRARRGQATDSHSLAERVRRKKISDRMNVLQNLVPGCHKVTSKALLLEEIINYIQSLKSQVEILSRKLAYIAPICAKFDQQNTGHLSQELLPLQATPDPTIVYGTAPNYVDHPDKVA